jgi:hypothetical protein
VSVRATLILAVLLACTPLRVHAQPSRTPLASGVTAFTNVAVIPMTSDTLLRDMTVIVRDGRIESVTPAARATIPNGARRIDGRGRFLIPGLADVHTHLYSDDEVADSLARYELGVMLANGVTVARLMIGTPEHLQLRTDVAEGRVLGPQLWLASPQLTGNRTSNARTVTTPDEARAAVREVAAAGYDFVKLTENIPPPVYDAIVDEARARQIRIDGHVDPRVGVARALAAGQNIQHLDAYFEAALPDSAPSRESLTQGGVFRLANWKSIDYIDDHALDRLAGATARARVWSTPTLTVFNTAFAIGFTDDELEARPDWQLMPSGFRQLYVNARRRYWNPASDSVRTPRRRQRYVEVRNHLTKAIVDSGGKVLAGSDSPDWFNVYGWTLHRELGNLVRAGLTPYQALAAATRNPSEYFGALGEWGTIQSGRRGDLVLLSANPLTDISNTTRIEGVAIGGRWIERPELEAMIRAATERINNR